MKRNILAVVIPALLAAGAANAAEIYNKDGNKLDLYGKVDGLHYFSDDSSNDGDETYVRFGFKGETKINDNITGYGQWEYNVQANNSEGNDAQDGNKTRLGFAGLKFNEYGSFDYGRNYGLMYDTIGWTDMMPEYGGDSGYSDGYLSGRSTGVATYRNHNFFGLVDGWDFAVQYQGKNDRTGDDVLRGNGDGYALSTSYTSSMGLGIVGSWSESNRTDAQKALTYGEDKNKARSWGTAVKYDANNIYIAALYTETRDAARITNNNLTTDNDGFANKAVTTEVIAQYQFDFGLRPSIAYVQSKGKDIEGIGDADLYKYYEVGATYYFNKNMSTYVDYKINRLDDNNPLGLATDDVVALGLVYQF
ncbi:porin OmpC [Rouxiella badensis]|nr:porin OmpC [Rouxiella badensis]QOI57822.1 porin OmpC [Rouxiella badensis subsp. acadiensis]MCC3717568.1 porin OmpC [Rouxiella badensis]MCC3727488.1 porin OmpC [Rouxiella badensis]MCC3732567.1 porin OmpC [Rouxiella badensis]